MGKKHDQMIKVRLYPDNYRQLRRMLKLSNSDLSFTQFVNGFVRLNLNTRASSK